MDDQLSLWESKLGTLSPDQRQHLLQWFNEERDGWADREEEWERVQATLVARVQQGGRAGSS